MKIYTKKYCQEQQGKSSCSTIAESNNDFYMIIV